MNEPELVERLRGLLKNASPLPWCWQQCGDKCDDPVIGVAWRQDDETYTAIPGCLEDFDENGNIIEYYRESIAYLGDANSPDASASANTMLIVEVVNALPKLLAALERLSRSDVTEDDVERVARAIAKRRGSKVVQHFHRADARAAIAAMQSGER